MQYLFKTKISVLSDGDIFVGDNARGYIENGTLCINDKQYSYTHENGAWYEKGYPCGNGRIPVLDIENLKIINQSVFNSIIYVPHEE